MNRRDLLTAALVVPQRVHVESAPLTSDVGQVLERTYGPRKYSMGPEEWIIRELVQDRRDGVFVDVGAADARVLSNTYYLEAELGWSGIAVDPQIDYAPGYAEHRPRTRYRPFFVSDRSDATLPFYIPETPEQASARRPAGAARETTVSTITLDDLLVKEGIERFDLLSMDIEEHEPTALAGFSIERFRPSVVAIEAHPTIRQQLLDYFARHGYVLQARYVPVDEYNFYFRPLVP